MNIPTQRSQPLTIAQLNNAYQHISDVIDHMPPKALNELVGGYEGDFDNLIDTMVESIALCLNFNQTLKSEDLHYLSNLEKHMDIRLRKISYNYFKTTVLADSFQQSWRNLEWGNLVQIFKQLCLLCSRGSGKSHEMSYAFILWRLYGYDKPIPGFKNSRENKNFKETLLISNEMKLPRKKLKEMGEEIENNEILKEKLNPNGKATLGSDLIITETNSQVHARSFGTAIRGFHVGAAVIDDFLNSSAMYSAEQRLKYEEVFYSEIQQAVNEGGYNPIIGCVAPDTLITTPDGLRRIGDLSPLGDVKFTKKLISYKKPILGKDGFKESSHYWHNGLTDTLKITLKYGYELECSQIHPLYVLGENDKPEWKQAKNIKTGDQVAIKINTGIPENSKKIDFSSVFNAEGKANTKNSELGNNWYSELIYLIGLYTTGSNFDKSGFITTIKKNKGIQKFLKSNKFSRKDIILKDLFEHVGYSFGVVKHQNFPDKIISSDKETIINFLQGLFDGGGCCHIDKKGKIRIFLNSLSEGLIKDVHNILGVLGIISSRTVSPSDISEKVKSKHDIHGCSIYDQNALIFLKLIGFKYSGKADNIPKDLITAETKLVDSVIPGQEELIYLPVAGIKRGKNWTVDFHIPDGHNFISNNILSHNTPFSNSDLYADFKKKKSIPVFEYPAIMPNGQILAPDLFSKEYLIRQRKLLSPLQYAREILITPLTDGAAIFPMEQLRNSIIGMQDISLIENKDALPGFPKKFSRIVIGCDFAKSAAAGADSTVYTVWGATVPEGGISHYYLLHAWKKRGATLNEQVTKLVDLNTKFQPHKIVIEANNFQSWMKENLIPYGIPANTIGEFTTNAHNKKDMYSGVPSLSTLFAQGLIKLPYAQGHSRDIADWLLGEFNSIAFNPDNSKLESVAGHDDGVMSSFMGIQDLRGNASSYKYYSV